MLAKVCKLQQLDLQTSTNLCHFPAHKIHALDGLLKIKALESINTGNKDMYILYAAVHQTSRDQEALPRPVSGSGTAPGMKHHSEHMQPWPECMKIAFTTTGHFDPSLYQCHMALPTISLAL